MVLRWVASEGKAVGVDNIQYFVNEEYIGRGVDALRESLQRIGSTKDIKVCIIGTPFCDHEDIPRAVEPYLEHEKNILKQVEKMGVERVLLRTRPFAYPDDEFQYRSYTKKCKH